MICSLSLFVCESKTMNDKETESYLLEAASHMKNT